MTFGRSLRVMLDHGGYSLISEFLTSHGRAAVNVQEKSSKQILTMFHSDALELVRGATTVGAVMSQNRHVAFRET